MIHDDERDTAARSEGQSQSPATALQYLILDEKMT